MTATRVWTLAQRLAVRGIDDHDEQVAILGTAKEVLVSWRAGGEVDHPYLDLPGVEAAVEHIVELGRGVVKVVQARKRGTARGPKKEKKRRRQSKRRQLHDDWLSVSGFRVRRHLSDLKLY